MFFDEKIFQILHAFAGKSFFVDVLFEFFATYLIFILTILLLYILVREKNWQKRIYFLSVSALVLILTRGLITETIRFFYQRARPFVELEFIPLISHEATASFPSGHTVFLFALVPLALVLGKKFGYWFLGGSLLVVISRVIAGVHWPSDILGGIVIGLLGYWLVVRLVPRFPANKDFTTEESKEPRPPVKV